MMRVPHELARMHTLAGEGFELSLSGAKDCWVILESRQASFSPSQEEPFQDQLPSWDLQWAV